MVNTKKLFIFKFFRMKKYIGRQEDLKILDVGAGNHSATGTKAAFPDCEYHAVDLSRNYANDPEDFKVMDQFYEMDLTKLEYEEIPDQYFDLIIISHVIEHLFNGDKVLNALTTKLKKGGFIYIEWPGIRSTKLPSKKGSLNFFDDETHVRIYSLQEIYNLMLYNKMKFCKGGTRHSVRLILLTPCMMLRSIMRRGYVSGSVFWDILGFAEYCIFRKE